MLKSNTKLRTLSIDQNKNNKTIGGENTILNKVTDVLDYNNTKVRMKCTWTLTLVHNKILLDNYNQIERHLKRVVGYVPIFLFGYI